MTAKSTKTKTSKSTDKTCETSSCGDTIESLQVKIDELVDLSTSFTEEIQNIMTTENLSFSHRASVLGTATKNFVSHTKEIKNR